MSEHSAEKDAPRIQGLDLFEHYESNGNLLVVTSDSSALLVEPGDVVYRRPWSTASPAVKQDRP